MATVVYTNAVILVDGASLATEFNELTVEYAAEMLDETCFGDDTRINKGGLMTGSISGAGFAELDTAFDAEIMAFERVGVDGSVIVVFPNGITEGTPTLMGYGMLGVLSEFTLGGAVGALLPFTMTAEGRGTVP